jgi:cephalosporin-C deacetylase-like acetyl esterase
VLGLKVDLGNYERAIGAFVTYLAELSEVDPERIGMFGISMSGYWGLRALAGGEGLAALAAFEAPVGDFKTMFECAQPSFKSNYIFMSGYSDEKRFDEEFASKMPVGELLGKIRQPVLMGNGEFDELTPIEEVLDAYEKIKTPKELRVFENEFHPLGGVAAEAFAFAADWVLRALDGSFKEAGRDVRHYVKRDGTTVDGDAPMSS